MIDPVTGAVVSTAVGLGASLLGKKKNAALPSVEPQMKLIDASGQRERDIAGGLTNELKPVNEQFGTDLRGAINTRRGEQTAAGDKFMSGFSSAGNARTAQESDLLKQRVLEAQPELQRQLREGLASTGQIGSGAGIDAFGNLATEAGRQIGQGQAELSIKNLEGLQDATKQVFGADTAFTTQALGIDERGLNTLLNSGREDLIREAQALINEARATTQAKVGVLGQGQDREMASKLGGAAADQDLRNAILGAAGRAAGGFASRQAQ